MRPVSTLHDFCKKARYVAEKAMEKTSEVVENAAFAIKKKALQMRLDEQYEKLGALLYRRFQNGEETGEEEAAIMTAIDELLQKIEALKNDAQDEEENEEAAEETDEQNAGETDGPA